MVHTVTLSLEDFMKSGLKETVNTLPLSSFAELSKDIRNMSDESDDKNIKAILQLISGALSMDLNSMSMNQPYKPFANMGNVRTTAIDDFTETDLIFFESIVSKIDNYIVVSRLADILWLRKKPRKKVFADMAIDSFMEFNVHNQHLALCDLVYGRSIMLLKQLGFKDDSRIEKLKGVLFLLMNRGDFEGRLAPLCWIRLLRKIHFQCEEQFESILDRLTELYESNLKLNEFDNARSILDEKIEWIKIRNNDLTMINDTLALIAESWSAELDFKEGISGLVRGHLCECAIKAYQRLPREYRIHNGLDSEIKSLRDKLKEANFDSLDGLHKIESDPINISEAYEESETFVKGFAFPAVLYRLATVYYLVDLEKHRKETVERLQGSISSLFSMKRLTTDGRVSARSNGEKDLYHAMIDDFNSVVDLIVRATILPSFKQVNLEHSINQEDLISICGSSCAIPIGREKLWAKGLFYGFDCQFDVAIHLLIPQIEHLVRVCMKEKGLVTSVLDSTDIEMEKGLSTLLDHDDIDSVFEPELLFVMRAVLSDNYGFNFRNNIAHGLINYEETNSSAAIYLWWFCLRLMVLGLPWSFTKH